MKCRQPSKKNFTLACLVMLSVLSSCGLRNQSEPAFYGAVNGTEEGEGTRQGMEGEAGSGEGTDGMIAVADFSYFLPDIPLFTYYADQEYCLNGEYFYYTQPVEHGGDGECYCHIARYHISDGSQEKDYIVLEKSMEELFVIEMLADKEGNCYMFLGPSQGEQGADCNYYLEKYGTDGRLQWQTVYTPEELSGKGMHLEQGTVTEDGRVFLYTSGTGGTVFSFGAGGRLDEVYTPGLDSLDRVVIGKGNKVYGYCATGVESKFMELGKGKEADVYTAPVVPLGVYDGYEDGLYLRTGDGLWRYVPETGEAVYLWGWDDAYVQVDGNQIDRIAGEEQGMVLLCLEQTDRFYWEREILTFAVVSSREVREYPGKQTVTMSFWYLNDRLRYLVRRYNRQSKEYRIEYVQEADDTELERKLLKGEASDLIVLNGLYGKGLVQMGALEDLTPYYEASILVDWEDILEPAREACIISGKNVAVMPCFFIDSLRVRQEADGVIVPENEWTVWKFLEMGEGKHVFMVQRPGSVFETCMGIRYGDVFVDYESKTCNFDSDEFHQILEECSRMGTYGKSEPNSVAVYEGEEEWLYDSVSIRNAVNAVSWLDEDYAERLVGYPGMEGAEYALCNEGMFAMNSRSENKEGAWDFLEYLVSEETQEAVTWAFPSRKDCFERYLADRYEEPAFSWNERTGTLLGFSGGLSEFSESTEAYEKACQKIWSMLDYLVPDTTYGAVDDPVRAIVMEEAEMYFAKGASLEGTVNKIQKRVQLMLDEN